MSDRDDAETPSSPHVNSDRISIEMYLFECGHGDTIFLRLPVDRWILIDCHLRSRATRERFFRFVEEMGIQRIEYIFQTHPDFDYFCGMDRVLEHFTKDGRTIGYWCDAGLDAKEVQALVGADEITAKEYRKLQDRLDDLDDRNLVEFIEGNDFIEPFSPAGYADRVDVFVVAPSADLKRRHARRDIGKLRDKPKARVETNALSLALVLSVTDKDKECNFLLAADVWENEAELALDAWAERAGKHNRRTEFGVIKVPHHGSSKSHSSRLCDARCNETQDPIAAISAGRRAALPDREVMREYAESGWTVMVTTPRTSERPISRLIDLANRSRRSEEFVVSRHNIVVSWNADDGLSGRPPEAIVRPADMGFYETAGDS